MVRGDGVAAGQARERKKNGFSKPILFFARCVEPTELSGAGQSAQSQKSSSKRGDSISGGEGIDFVKADQTATASDSAMDPPPPPAPMESDEEQDDESVPEVPGTTI